METKSGQLFDVTAALPKSVKLSNKTVKCEICNKSFAAKKYLDTHVRFKHNSENSNRVNLGKDLLFHNRRGDRNVSECTATNE